MNQTPVYSCDVLVCSEIEVLLAAPKASMVGKGDKGAIGLLVSQLNRVNKGSRSNRYSRSSKGVLWVGESATPSATRWTFLRKTGARRQHCSCQYYDWEKILEHVTNPPV